MIAVLFLVACVLLTLAFFTYGRFVERALGIDDRNPTPAHTMQDGVDYVPAADPVLFGHHFSSIAGAGPIVGPIVAGLAFGWLPALLWIIVGSIFVGGVHDFSSLTASIRHKGQSIGQICRAYLSPAAYVMFLIFIWFTLVYVLIVFLDLTAGTFAPVITGDISEAARTAAMRRGGTVATSAILYIVIAIAFGMTVYRGGVKLGKASLVFVPLIFLALWVGYQWPLTADHIPALAGSSKNTWAVLLLVYCLLASITPVWILLQPRDYLSSFLLYACLLGGGLGLLLGGFSGQTPLAYHAFIGWRDVHLGFIFPALVITVACGAVSGFHSMVASGTTSKQLNRERSARRIGYGSMLVEAVLAIVALAAVMLMVEKPPAGTTPVAVFAGGIGRFLSVFGIPDETGKVFGLLAVSTFLLTTLDTCTRLARFVLQELLNLRGATGRVTATLVTLALPAVLVFVRIPGPGGAPMPVWKAIWPAFGACNQMLAALALLVVFTWLRHEGRRVVYIVLPMIFMFITTLVALFQLVYKNLFQQGSGLVGGLSLVLMLLTVVLLTNAVQTLRRPVQTQA